MGCRQACITHFANVSRPEQLLGSTHASARAQAADTAACACSDCRSRSVSRLCALASFSSAACGCRRQCVQGIRTAISLPLQARRAWCRLQTKHQG
jgi:hypothetical protein